MEIENITDVPDTATSPSKISNSQIIVGIVLFILSVGSAFAGGYYLRNLLISNTTLTSTTPSPSSSSNDSVSQEEKMIEGTINLAGKEYHDDTIMAVTQDTPRRILIATASRQETDNGANQASRVSFFDGDNWTRKINTSHHENTAIFTNNLIGKWDIQIDPSRVLKQSVNGSIKVDQNTIGFETGTLSNNIGMRSLPGYTKFISNQNGNLNINGSKVRAKILYTRIYSNNSSEMQFYETPFGLTTNWLAFWDNDGNFYHVDKTVVDKSSDKYQTHQVGVKVDKNGSVTKTFEVEVNYDSENPPASYQIKLGEPINQKISFTIGKSVNKAPSNAYKWFMSEGTGLVDNETEGYGAIEYIHN